MKKLYFILSSLLIVSQVSTAQLTLTKASHEPVVGEINYGVKYDSTTAVPKTTGAGMNWNFSNLSLATFTETMTYTTVASTPSASSFPNASISVMRGTNNWEFYRTTPTMMEYDGSLDQSSNEIVTFSNRGTWILWPTSFGTNNSDIFAATQTTGTNSATWNGNISYTATGSGTVVLPNGNTHTNCLQIKRNISLSITSGTFSTMITIVQYDYYSSSVKAPIVTIEYNTQTTGTVVTKDFNASVNQSALTVGINESNITGGNFIIYPNPASDNVNVFLPNNETPESIEVIDMIGRVVASSIKSTSVTTNELAKGVYTIRVKSKDAFSQKPLVISE